MAPNDAIKALGELALHCFDLKAMKVFYRDIVGLEIFSEVHTEEVPGLVFLKIADAVPGHPQLLALFDRPRGSDRGPLGHFAFIIELADYESQHKRLESLGIPVVLREFPTFHWRSIFFADPEGNSVELVAHDPEVR